VYGLIHTNSSDIRRFPKLELKANPMSRNHDQFYIERRDGGDYAVRRGGSDRASAIESTQGAAIERARQMDPNAPIHVERVRDTDVGGRDKWRKP
jgi:hypothetical protein